MIIPLLFIHLLNLRAICVSSLLTSNVKCDLSNLSKVLACITVCGITLSADAVSIENVKVTSKALLDLSINRKAPERVEIGVFGNDAPVATKIFLSVCEGTINGDLSYDFSQVSRIKKNKRIDIYKFSQGSAQKQETYLDEVGKARIRSVDLAANYVNQETNNLRHDFDGAVSVPRGGKSFGFTIAPRANPDLDKENLIIGEVLSGMETVEKVNNIPVSREDILGTKGSFSSLGKGVDPRAKLAAVDRPLQKVQIVRCVVEETASLPSFLKF